jgi:hypothetical protein
VPSDTSPPSGYRLETPARTAGGAGGAGGPGGPGGAPGRQQPADPPWIKVIGTTLRLWLRRRVLRVPDSAKISGPRLAGLVGVAVVFVAAVAVGVAVAAGAVTLTGSRPGQAAQPRRHHGPARPVVSPAQAAASANGQAAAAWITAQVSPQALIGCDPAMCADLQAAGFPAGQQIELQPGAGLAASLASRAGSAGLGSATTTLVAATAVLRAQYGTALASAAPAVLASFGTGPEAVQLRLSVPGGAAAYQQDASRALAARRTAGRALVLAGRVHMHAAAEHELDAGLVDPRLVVVLNRLAAAHPFYLVRFSDSGPLAGSAVPFRLAEIDGLLTRSGHRQVSELSAVLKLLRAQRAPYLAELTVLHQASGRVIVTVEFPAPSPF